MNNLLIVILVVLAYIVLKIPINILLGTIIIFLILKHYRIDTELFTTSNEAVQNISAVYNSGKVTSNEVATGTLTATNANISGSCTTPIISSLTTLNTPNNNGKVTLNGDLEIKGKLIVDGHTNLKNYLILTGWTGFATKDIYNQYQGPNTVVIGGSNENGMVYWYAPPKNINVFGANVALPRRIADRAGPDS